MSLTLPDDSTDSQFQKTMLAMVAFGVGSVVGCLVIGQVVDRYSSKKAAVVNLTFICVTMGTAFTFEVEWTYGVAAFAMCFMWGV